MDDVLIISIYDGCWMAGVAYGSTVAKRSKAEFGDDPILERVFVLYPNWVKAGMGIPFSLYFAKRARRLIKGYKHIVVCEDGAIERLTLKN